MRFRRMEVSGGARQRVEQGGSRLCPDVEVDAHDAELIGELVEGLAESEVVTGLRVDTLVWHAQADRRSDLRGHAHHRLGQEGPWHGHALALALAHEDLPAGADLEDRPAAIHPSRPAFAAARRPAKPGSAAVAIPGKPLRRA